LKNISIHLNKIKVFIIMNEKIKRLADNLSEIISDSGTVQDVYVHLRKLMQEQKDYFSNLKPQDMVKVMFYIWSIKKTGNFKLGDKLLNKILFATLMTTQGNNHSHECENCSGNGETACEYCYGEGRVDCDECGGSGDITCPECGGSGEDSEEGGTCDECNGSTEITCPDCGGDGRVDCDYCIAGYDPCSECNGTGEIELDDLDYSLYFIVTWNDFIKDRCELTEGSPEIAFSEFEFDRLRDEYVILHSEDDFAELKDFVETNEMYCVSQNDNPIIDYGMDMYILSHDYSMKPYRK
jgi:hypothetical protein